ncbi:aromatic acid exporter family protein [Streptomyces sp. A012304]|uniref:aromatic acid exporter family protein n=1 Tax=Streptomyces sp. A012304 TaxID=375446 RepID=UPI00222F99A0|nr:aromatic acid exporter family protein [Streptomyces sp. A012304]GKQ33800.1 FUSC family protein [Streptomyces sp. A012304]
MSIGVGKRWTEAVRREAGAVARAVRAARSGPGRERDLIVQSLKATLAAVLAWLVGSVWLGDPMALMAPWVALVLVQTTVYGSLRQAAQQWTAICAGTLLASAAQALTGDTLGALALSVPLLMLLAHWPRFGDQGIYAATTAVFTLASGAVSVSAVGHRVGQAALGAVIGVVVNALVLPPVHLRDVRENLAALAREAGETLHAVAAGLADGEWDGTTADDWSRGAGRLERRCEGLRSARGWSRESLRLTTGPLRALHRVPLDVPPEWEDGRWSRVAEHVTALTRTLAVAADDDRAPAPPEAAALRVYARLLELIGDACRAEADRFLRAGPTALDGAGRADRGEAEMRELRARLQDSLRDHAGRGAAHTAVLGTLLLQAENLWAEVLPGARRESRQA